MSTNPVLLTDDPRDGVRVLTLNRPHRLNAFDAELVGALLAELERAEADFPAVRVVLLRGAGRAFCSGADLRWLSDNGVLRDPPRHVAFQDALGRLGTTLSAASFVVISAVHGYALAGGLEMAMAGDLIVVAQDAQLGDEHITKGILPGGGGSQRLPRRIGASRGLFHLLTGRRLTGQTAVDVGLACMAAPAGELDATSLDLASEVAQWDAYALKYMKAMVRRGMELPLEDALRVELFFQSRYRASSGSMDRAAGMFPRRSDEG